LLSRRHVLGLGAAGLLSASRFRSTNAAEAGAEIHGMSAFGDLKYRNPYQASLDGNTVETPVEQAAFSENNVRYQASLNFINGTISELQLAINGQ